MVAVAVPAAPSHSSAPLRFVRVATGPSTRLPASTYRRRRAVAAGLVAGLVLLLATALGMLGSGPRSAPERPTPAGAPRGPAGASANYVVEPGDTFWSIARKLHPERDPRPLVDRMVAAHRGPTLYVGERIPLPA